MSAITHINHIRKLIAHPCATPDISVLVETAIPAATLALLEVFMFGCRDVQKMRRGRTPWHSRGLSAILRKKNLGVKVGPRTWVFEIATFPIEMALNYFFFADVATGFIDNWTSLIYQMSNCSLPGAGHFSVPLGQGFVFPNSDTRLTINAVNSVDCAMAGGDRIRVQPGCTAAITWTTEFSLYVPEIFGFGETRTWLVETTTGVRYSESDGWPQGGGVTFNGGGVTLRTPPATLAREYEIHATSTGGIHFLNRGSVSVSAYGRKMEIMPTGCKPIDYDNPYPHPDVPKQHQAKEGNFFGIGGVIPPHR